MEEVRRSRREEMVWRMRVGEWGVGRVKLMSRSGDEDAMSLFPGEEIRGAVSWGVHRLDCVEMARLLSTGEVVKWSRDVYGRVIERLPLSGLMMANLGGVFVLEKDLLRRRGLARERLPMLESFRRGWPTTKRRRALCESAYWAMRIGLEEVLYGERGEMTVEGEVMPSMNGALARCLVKASRYSAKERRIQRMEMLDYLKRMGGEFYE